LITVLSAFKSLAKMGLWTSALHWAARARETIQKYGLLLAFACCWASICFCQLLGFYLLFSVAERFRASLLFVFNLSLLVKMAGKMLLKRCC
jgi:hypothetical protein